MIDCAICYGGHNPAIHEATVSIHAWLKTTLQEKVEAALAEDGQPPRDRASQPQEASQAKPRSPRPAPPNRIVRLTQEAVVAGYRRGLTTPQIARELECRPQTVLLHIMQWRRESAEFRKIDNELQTCPACKGSKRRYLGKCSVCTASGKKRPKPGAVARERMGRERKSA